MRQANKSPGRPLRGKHKRTRVSFTLEPALANWLTQAAGKRSLSSSELLDQVIEFARVNWQAGEVYPRIKIPYEGIRKVCKEHHVKKLSLYGSALSDNFMPESDIDLLAEFEATPSLFEIVRISQELSEIFDGKAVDLKTAKELSRYFRTQVLDSAQVLYES